MLKLVITDDLRLVNTSIESELKGKWVKWLHELCNYDVN